MRTTPMPPRPAGVAMATMVSEVEYISFSSSWSLQLSSSRALLQLQLLSTFVAVIVTVFTAASPMLSDVTPGTSATAR